jgi:hypothetical protein
MFGKGGRARVVCGGGGAKEFAYKFTFRVFKGNFTDYLRNESLYTETQMAPS